MLERAQPAYAVNEPTLRPTEQIIAAVTGPSVGLADLETMLKHLLPDVPAQAPPPLSAPTDLKTMLKRLLPAVLAQAPLPLSAPTNLETMLKRLLPVVTAHAPPPRPTPTELEAILKCLLPGTLTPAPPPHPARARRNWAAVLCFSCGNYGHGASSKEVINM